ncbi:retrovirus polyprotein [Purpureocillium lavendulum]|uniref:Retrovirus polyprotein n=1 Tax=Purpureocillium lavendulum TaxID=1247861 RepID=A0AB34FJV4_9HYPO|nr:retrovirus polyprotein [Purpureocillium lavendulum]
MYANIGINREYYSKVFIDCGCLCYGTVNETFVRKLRLPRIPIRPRTLDQISTSLYGAIRGVTYADIDIDGYRKNRVFFYIIPGQDDEVILGRTWMNQEDVTLYPSKGLLHIGSQDHWVKERDPNRTERYELSGQSAATFAGLVRRARKENEKEGKRDQRGLRVFSASMADIEKALAPKKRTDAREKLPTHYHEYLSVFDRDEADRLPPHRPGSDHRIVLETDADGRERDAPWGPLYGMSREELIVLRRTLTELLDKGFIRASSSPASAPVLFVRKPGGGLRFCVDYRGLNAITKKDRYPLPLIEETLRSLSKAKWLTKLDVIAAFHKVRVAEGDEWKTAFRTRYGLYEWLVTPFGLTGAPATFQRYINHTLREFLDEFCSAYIDDILIYSSGSLADHRKKVKQVLARLRDAGLQIDIDKCEFETTSVKYLGFIVEAGKGIRVDPEKVRAIQEWEAPRSARAVRSFLGFANYYRQFIPKFSNIASPLTALTKKDAAFAWSSECQAAFDELKARLISAPVLAQWDPDRETIVETDSSGYVTGGALSQKGDDGLMRPVAFFSKKCAPAECNYPIHDKELLAIMRCLQHWDAELRSVESFTVLTDHLNLRYFTRKQPLSERQARWAETLSRYNFTIVHRPGKDAAVPDALSRREQDMPHSADDERLRRRHIQLLMPAKGGGLVTRVKSGYVSKGDADQPGDETTEQDELVENPFTEPELQELWKEGLKQHNRYWLIRRAVQDGERRLPSQWGLPVMLSECSIDAGQRLCWRERIWVPNHEPLRTRLMQETHDSALAGHPGRDMLKSLLARRFYWPGLDADARQFVRNCDVCGRSNVWREKRRGLLKPLPVPERIWSELSIDFVTDLPPTKSNGSTNMMVLTDRLSKSVVLESLRDITAETTARALMRNVLQHHGIPAAIVTDRGTQFTSRMWKRLCELLRIKQRLSTAWHPETDGATERANQEVERYIRIFTTYAQDDWDELLPAAAMALNNRMATSTGLSPFFFTHGYHLEPVQVKEVLRPDGKSPVAKAEGIVRRFQEATEWAQAAMASAQERQEDNANTRRQPSDQYKPGDKVWLRLRNIRSKRPSKKLDWLAGKYTVLETVGSHACRLDTPPGVHNVFHVSLLRLAADDPLPSQTSDDYRPPAILTDDGELWEVEEICGHKKVGREWKVLVKWVGWVGPTWEPVRFLSDTTALAHGLTMAENKVKISPFKVDIAAKEIERMQRKLQDTRLPGKEIVPGAGPRYGPTYEWAADLYDTWLRDFDWFAVQEEMNEIPHFIAEVEDVNLHFVHARAENPNAIPLLMVHGWPGAFRWGLGKPNGDTDKPAEESLTKSRFFLFLAELFYSFSLAFSKLAILAFYWRMFKITNIRIPILVLVGTAIVWLILRTFLAIFHCIPVQAFWDTTIQGATCVVNQSAYFFGTVLTHLIMDIAILILPIVQVSRLQLQRVQKFGVIALFMFGILVCIASVVILVESLNFNLQTEHMAYDITMIGEESSSTHRLTDVEKEGVHFGVNSVDTYQESRVVITGPLRDGSSLPGQSQLGGIHVQRETTVVVERA